MYATGFERAPKQQDQERVISEVRRECEMIGWGADAFPSSTSDQGLLKMTFRLICSGLL